MNIQVSFCVDKALLKETLFDMKKTHHMMSIWQSCSGKNSIVIVVCKTWLKLVRLQGQQVGKSWSTGNGRSIRRFATLTLQQHLGDEWRDRFFPFDASNDVQCAGAKKNADAPDARLHFKAWFSSNSESWVWPQEDPSSALGSMLALASAAALK